MALMLRLWLLAALCALTLGCQTSKSKSAVMDDAAQAQSVQDLLSRAERADPMTKRHLLLSAAEQLLDLGDTDWARSLVNTQLAQNYGTTPPTPADTARLALIKSRLAMATGYYPLAYEHLNTQELLAVRTQVPLEQARAIAQMRAELLFDMAFYPSSIHERIQLSELLPSGSEESQNNDQAIWQTLMALPQEELQKLAEHSETRDQRGWYLLALLSKDNQTNLRQQWQAVDNWVAEWPDHPASVHLPADLQLLQQLLAEQPQQIALLLPFNGRLAAAAGAIRDGFMAAYYQTREQGDMPLLRLYDTDGVDINVLYDQAIKDGADLVIGPLTKENIQELALRPGLPVPTLALNTVDNPLGLVDNLYQFGLGVEDEAAQAAERAWRDGHRRALLIAPNSLWGDRSIQAFAETWRQLGGELIRDYRFEETGDYSRVIKTAMQLDQSERRAQEIRALVGSIEFEPRRRQDIDMIFLAAQAAHARQIKPTLAFHYASDIPVYATSQVYSGRTDTRLDQDMNGIRFSTLPWFFNRRAAEKTALDRVADPNPGLQPLYAMGVDSFHLYPRLRQLAEVRQAHFYGYTGKLRLNAERQIQRQQVWAEFRGGQPRLLADSD